MTRTERHAKQERPDRGSVLVVDDDPTVLKIVSRYLEHAGFAARVAADGPDAMRLSVDLAPDLVVLDLMLPGMDGLDVMQRLCERAHVPVILLSAKRQPADRVNGLRLGADDYVGKPFSPGELVARVEAVLRRIDRGQRTRPIESAGLRIDPAVRCVTVGGEEVTLTPLEYATSCCSSPAIPDRCSRRPSSWTRSGRTPSSRRRRRSRCTSAACG